MCVICSLFVMKNIGYTYYMLESRQLVIIWSLEGHMKITNISPFDKLDLE